MREVYVNFLKDLLRIYTPSGYERRAAEFLIRNLTKMGFKVTVDSAGNVVGEIGSGKPKTLLCAHIDTIPGFIDVKVEGDRIYGRGAVDAKGPLASMIFGAYNFSKFRREGTVIVAAVVNEETDSSGIRQLIRSGLRPDFAIFGEPSGLSNITVGYRGRLEVHAVFKTSGGHAASPWLYKNAIDWAYNCYHKLKEKFQCEYPSSRFSESISITLTKIKGGKASNVIPDICKAVFDIRIPFQVSSRDIINEIKETFSSIHEGGIDAEFEIKDKVEPYQAERKSILVRLLKDSIRETGIKTIKLVKKTGTSDMNILGHELNVPVVAYGPGDPYLEHTDYEFINVEEYLKAIKIYESLLLKLSDYG